MNNIFEQLIRDEGNIPHVYQDPKGYWTIGVGHLVDERKGGKISQRIAFELLQDDVAEKLEDIQTFLPWVDTLDEPRRGVLVNLCFMLGINGLLQFKNMLRAIRDREYETAAKQLLDSEMARDQKALAGDKETRAERLAKQLISGKWV